MNFFTQNLCKMQDFFLLRNLDYTHIVLDIYMCILSKTYASYQTFRSFEHAVSCYEIQYQHSIL